MKSMFERKMLRVCIAAVCSAGLAASAGMAQQEAPPPPPSAQQQGPQQGGPMRMNPEHRLEMMQRRLQLTDDQTEKLRQIFMHGRAKMDELRANTSLAPEDRHAQMMDLRKDMMARVEGILTPDQRSKLEQMQARMRARQQEREQNSKGGNEAPPTGTSGQGGSQM